MAITAQMVKELREKGIAKAAKKADRIAAEGLTHIEIDNNTAAILEVNCETDFVTKNDQFKTLLTQLAQHIVKQKPATVEEALGQELNGEGESLETIINRAVSTIGEKISLRRFAVVEKTDSDAFGAYLHMGGRIGVLSLIEGTTDEQVGKDVSMHVAAVNPRYVSRDAVSEEEVNREREVLKTQALNEGKPENIVEKMVEGRLGKFFEEIVLLEQSFVKDPDQKVKKYVADKGATVKSFVRYEVGEGMEKREENFADEVMSQIKK